MESKTRNLIDNCKEKIFSFAKYLNYIAGVIIAMMMFLVAIDVTARYILRYPLPWTKSVLEVMLVAFPALSYAYVESKKGHLQLTFVTSKLPKKTNDILETVTDILGCIMLVITAIMCFKNALDLKVSGKFLNDINTPIYPYAYVLTFGIASYTVVKIFNLLYTINVKGVSFWLGSFIAIVISTTLLLFMKLGFKLSPTHVGFIGLAALLVVSFAGMHLQLAMLMIAFSGIVYIRDFPFALKIIGVQPYSVSSSYSFTVYPLFMYMGVIVYLSGIGDKLYETINKWIGHIPGGLAMATVTASALFAAISGSGTANAATMGKVALPEMRKFKYNDKLAIGSIAAGGTLGPLIPPSTIFVLYGLLTQQPIGKLFIAGIFPGLLKLLLYILLIKYLVRIKPDWAPLKGEKANFKDKMFSLRNVWPVAVLFTLVMGGLYAGAFTPSEAAGIGSFGAVLCAIFIGGFSFKTFFKSSIDTTETVGGMFFILVCSVTFGVFLTVTRLPFQLADYIASLTFNRYIIIAIFIFVMLIMGAIMDIFSVVVVVVPIVFPSIVKLGFDPIWFGVLICWLFEIGALTPPIGINIFVMKNVARDVPLETMFSGVMPFYILDMLAIILLVAYPKIATYLPELLW